MHDQPSSPELDESGVEDTRDSNVALLTREEHLDGVVGPAEGPAAPFAAELSARRPGLIHRVRHAGPEPWITAVVVAVCAGSVFWRLQPAEILSDSTPTGGDMGAHVWGPAFLRDELLSSGRLRGWSPDWYAGFPAMQFYMVVPYLLIVLLDVVLPYGTAFKLVAVSGVVSLPISAWAFGRLARMPFPLPPLMAIGGMLFVFDFNFTIYGGNIASTLAGEFAFSISLSLALLYLGLVVRALDTGRGRALAAIVLSLVALCHLIPLLFAVIATVVIVAVRGLHRLPGLLGTPTAASVIVGGAVIVFAIWNASDRALPRLVVIGILAAGLLLASSRQVWWALAIGLTGGLLSAFWTVPFLMRREYLNDMGWQKLEEVRENLFFPDELGGDGAHLSILWLLGLALIAAVAGLVQWNRVAMTFTAIAATFAVAFIHWPQHRLWNARLLPFWFLALYLLAAFAVFVLARSLVAGSDERGVVGSPRRIGRVVLDRPTVTRLATAPIALAIALLFVAFYLGAAPGGRYDEGDYEWGPFTASSGDRNFVSGWARWNFTGYEERSGYPEYFDLVNAMENVGDEFGCGRALWEYDRDRIGSYGTPMAPMLLPHWTDGCIASMEGLYFESSPTVPFHFLMQSELSANPSRPMRDLPYTDLDVETGAQHLQMSGVRYYVAFSNEALAAASRVPDRLEPIAFSDPWTVFLVHDSEIVEPLRYEPVVAEDVDNAGRAWTDPAVTWFQDADRWDVPVAADGPEQWARVELIRDRVSDTGRELLDDFGVGPERPLDAVTVSNIENRGDALSFSVDEVGVPVLVKISYFPNWKVSGAEGPYRVTPNWMVVVPTETEVTLTYGRTAVENLAWALSALGVAAALLLARSGRWERADAVTSGATPADDESVPPAERAEPIEHESVGAGAPHPEAADDASGRDRTVPEIEPLRPGARSPGDVDGPPDPESVAVSEADGAVGRGRFDTGLPSSGPDTMGDDPTRPST